MARRYLRKPANWFEPAMALGVLALLVRAAYFFSQNGYLPQPFFYDPHDTWMDWFNPAYWAYEPGTYDSWGSIYPPLSFVFLRIFSISHCYANGADPYAVRGCDWVGLATVHAFWLLNLVLLWFSFRKIDKSTALWRTIALGFGLPTASGLERGNLVVVCFTFVILAFGPLLKSARWRWIAAGMAINFKVYLIAGIFPQLLRRKWLWFEGALISTIAIYCVTFAIFGTGTPLDIYRNITDLTGGAGNFSLTDLWNSTTYSAFIATLSSQYLVLAGSLGSRNIDFLMNVLPVVQMVGKVVVGSAAVAAWYRPEAITMHRLTFLGLGFAMTASETGGYTECFLIFLVMHEPWRGWGRKIALISGYILLLPGDIPVDQLPMSAMDSYLAGHTVFVTYYVSVGHFLRPAVVLLMVCSLAITTVFEVLIDIRDQGWSSRWRYRHDGFRLPGMVAPWRRPTGKQRLAVPHTEQS